MKTALESLTNVGTVDVTRKDAGRDQYSWYITFTEPATSAYSVSMEGSAAAAALSFPLIYAGGGTGDEALGLSTLGTGGKVNATRLRRGTLGPLSGEVSIFHSQ